MWVKECMCFNNVIIRLGSVSVRKEMCMMVNASKKIRLQVRAKVEMGRLYGLQILKCLILLYKQ